MKDPRHRLGLELHKPGPPFKLVFATPETPDDGGTLDLGIVGTLPNGREVVIGELWAAAPGRLPGERWSLDNRSFAEALVDHLNAEPEGPFCTTCGENHGVHVCPMCRQDVPLDCERDKIEETP